MPCPPTLPTTPARPAAVRWSGVLKAVGLVVLMSVCYWRTFDGGFFWDDHLVIPGNPAAQSLHGLWKIWFSTEPYDYYPLTYTAFWAEWHLWGDAPLGYHFAGFLLDLANASLLWALLDRLRVPGAWLGAVWFAIHPVNMASVAWVAEQKNTFSMLFYLGSLLAFVRSGALTDARVLPRWYAASFGLFVLAALSKSAVVMLPVVLLLLIWWKRGRVGRRDATRTLPYFAVSLAAGLGTIWFHHHRMAEPAAAAVLPVAARVSLAVRVIGFYLEKALVPVRLSMIYPRWDANAFGWTALLPGLALAAGLITGWTCRGRWGRGPFTALMYFVLTLLPVSGLLAAALFKDSFVFDHLVYFALVGIVAGLAAALDLWRQRGSPLAAPVVMTIITVLLVMGSLRRADDFSSSENLWRSTLAINPGSTTARNNLGVAFLDQRRFVEAESCFRAALRLEPGMVDAATNLANVLRQKGQWTESATIYKTALVSSTDAQCFNNYGVVCLQLGDSEGARQQFRRAAQLEPQLVSPHFNLYKMFSSQGDLQAATDELGECLRADPDDVPSLMALAVLDIRSAPSGTVPAEAVALARRARNLAGTHETLATEILVRAGSAPPVAGGTDRLPEIAVRIRRIVGQLDKS